MPDGTPALRVFFEEDVQGRIVPDPDLSDSVWIRFIQIAREYDPDLVVRPREVIMEWPAAVASLKDIAPMRKSLGFAIEPVGEATEMLRRSKAERQTVNAARKSPVVRAKTREEIEELLEGMGFTTEKRRLKDFQVRDLSTLLRLEHGANFSVPGSGKTTVSLALHLLTRSADTHLLVICPKNAISPWLTVVNECIREDAPNGNAAPFLRLDGEAGDIARLLRSGHKRFVLTYDRAIRIPAILREYLSTHPVHVVLDESHRIKAGVESARGRIIGQLAPLPIRRDILTGTPLPNGVQDLAAQVDFLWPGQGLGRLIDDAGSPRTVIRNLYVRTTKSDLGLPERNIRFENVEMGNAQLGLYTALKVPVIRQLKNVRKTNKVSLSTRNNVMRLLEASSNPVLAVRAMGASYAPPIDPTDAICNAVFEEGDSNKILRACEIARDLARRGRKSVIWALFQENVDRLLFLLDDLGVINIDGRVPSGDPEDYGTREGRVSRFHDSDGPTVLVANPAACSEGINLHMVCHDAIYLERSYNAAHYLQSLDRIHRLGLPQDVITNVTILQSIAPAKVGSIDHSVGVRMRTKMRAMYDALYDPDLKKLMLDEESAEPPVSLDADLDDLADLLEQLITGRLPNDDEQE